MKFGEYLIKEKILTNEQLKNALDRQADNPRVKLGEILITMDYFSVNELKEYITGYVQETGMKEAELYEWLSQDQADQLIFQLKSNH